jgi:hypothetical protein
MKLKFYAREDLLAYAPGSRPTIGSAPPYIGRELRPDRSLPATEATAEFDLDPATQDGRERLARFTRLLRVGAIWAADAATAAACGGTYVPVTYQTGAWIQAPPPKKDTRK